MSSYPPPGSPDPFGPQKPFSPPQAPLDPFAQFGQQPQQPQLGAYPAAGPYGYASQPTTSPMAILSMVAGIGSLLFSWVACCCSPVILVPSLGSVVFGHLALGQISRSQGRMGGGGLALAGLLAGYPALLFSGAMSAFMVYVWINPPDKNAPGAGGPAVASAPATAASALSNVETKIISKSNGVAQGNSPEAIALAEEFSIKMKTLREALFTEEKRKGISLSDGEFITWCELRDDKCAFVVHVPSYRKFTSDAQESLEELAWSAAQHTVRGKLKEGDALAVGMKGVILYGSVMVGKVVAEDSDDDGLDDQSEDKENLYPFFKPEITPAEFPLGEPPMIELPAAETPPATPPAESPPKEQPTSDSPAPADKPE